MLKKINLRMIYSGLLSLSLIGFSPVGLQTSAYAAGAQCGAAEKKASKSCDVQTGLAPTDSGKGISQDAGSLSGATASCAAQNAEAASQCEKAVKECTSQQCECKEAKGKLESALAQAASCAADSQQSSNVQQEAGGAGDEPGAKAPSGGGGGDGAMMGALAGAALGALGMKMYMDKKDKDKKKKEEETPDETAAADCNLESSVGLADCANHYISTCSVNATGANCLQFIDTYCPETSSGASTETDNSSSDAVANDTTEGSTTTAAKAGAGTQFCAFARSSGYCSDETKKDSPACLWLQSRGVACVNDPTSIECLPQYETKQALSAACSAFTGDPICIGGLEGSLLGTWSFNSTGSNGLQLSSVSTSSGLQVQSASGSASALASKKSSSVARMAASAGSYTLPNSRGSVWKGLSSSIATQCEKGQLVDCGPMKLPSYVKESIQ